MYRMEMFSSSAHETLVASSAMMPNQAGVQERKRDHGKGIYLASTTHGRHRCHQIRYRAADTDCHLPNGDLLVPGLTTRETLWLQVASAIQRNALSIPPAVV